MVAAKNHSVGAGPFDLLYDCGVVDCTRGDTLEQDDLGLAGFFDKGLGKLGQPLAVITFVMNDGDLFGADDLDGKLDLGLGLGIVGSDGPEEIGIVTGLSQVGIGGGRRHDNDPGFLIDGQSGLGGP